MRGPRRPTLVVTALLGIVAVPSAAHPPYEHTDRVITASDARRLSLVRSYGDGIFFTDPVKLVVRDEDERTVTETEYGRDLAIICPHQSRCFVYRYEGLMPVFPDNIWRFEDGVLNSTHSASLVALGIVAPLWEHAGGYIFAAVSLGLPFLIWTVNWKGRSPKNCLVGIVSLATIPYAPLWLYTVILLSRLSLPLVVATGVLVAATIVLARRTSLSLGATEIGIRRAARFSLMVVGGLAVIAIAWAIVAAVRVASYSYGLSFDEPPVTPPLASARLTRSHGITKEVFAELAPRVRIEQVVNLDLFDGFEGEMTRDEAVTAVGPASGRWTDPAYRTDAAYYQRPEGRVSLVRRADSWTTVGHPSKCTLEHVFRDTRLREQLVAWLPPDGVVQVNFREAGGGNVVTVWMSRDSCTHLVLTHHGAPYGP